MSTKKPIFSIPIHVTSASSRFYLVAFTTLFAFVFLNVFSPFGLYYEGTATGEEVFIELSIAMFSAFFVMLFTQFMLRPLVRVSQSSWVFFIIWFLLEAILVSAFWTMLDLLDGKSLPIIALWLENFFAFTLTLSFPYFIYLIVQVLREMNSENLTLKSNKTEDHTYSVNLKDEAGVIRLTLPLAHIRLIQSADNYLEVHYLENEEIQTFLLRNSMKDVEQQLSDTSIVRCHRSVMVNKEAIVSVKKMGGGLQLVIRDVPNRSIPVSKSYLSEFRKVGTRD